MLSGYPQFEVIASCTRRFGGLIRELHQFRLRYGTPKTFTTDEKPRSVVRPPLRPDHNVNEILQVYLDSKDIKLASGFNCNPGNGDVNPWYQNSGITAHLADRNLKALRLLRVLLQNNEGPLRWASSQVDPLFRTYLKTFEARAVDLARRWMDSTSMNQMLTGYISVVSDNADCVFQRT